MKNKTKIKIILSIFGNDFSLVSLSSLLEISPSNSWLKGEKIRNRSDLLRKETAWEFQMEYEENLFLETITEKLLNIFNCKSQAIKKFIEEHKLNTKVDIVVIVYDAESPALFLNNKFIRFLNEINAVVDIDLYIEENNEN
ncbi:MAG: DUF4279 domain-containing protein [Saprospiraceae bacterium]|nr:DUF4279 domain-containing protein [Saprospiraceae bacterium]